MTIGAANGVTTERAASIGELMGLCTNPGVDTLSVDSVTQGVNGAVAISLVSLGGKVTYDHDGSDTTSDSFTYTVRDGNGGTDTGTVVVAIAP